MMPILFTRKLRRAACIGQAACKRPHVDNPLSAATRPLNQCKMDTDFERLASVAIMAAIRSVSTDIVYSRPIPMNETSGPLPGLSSRPAPNVPSRILRLALLGAAALGSSDPW